MRNTKTGSAEVIKSRRNYQKYVLILLFMSAMVAGMVVLGLMQPAVTMTYTCGFNYEHTHSIENGCYELICGMDEGDIEEDGVTPHVHSESCYDMSHTICGFEEHKHTDECFVKEEDKEAEATEAAEETEPAEVLAEEMTEETTEAAPEVIEIRNIDLGEIYALDRKSTELSAQEAAKLTHNSPAFDISDYVEDMSYDEDSNIAEDSEKENAVQLTMKFRIPAEAFEDENRTVYCKLPEAVSLGDKQTARLYMSEAFDDTMPYEICRYKLEPKENMLIMQLSQEQIGDGNCSVVCKFKFDAIVKMDDAEAENQTISEGDVTLEVKAPLLKNYTVADGEDPTEPTTDPTTDPAETTAETSDEPEETTTVTIVAVPELVITKSPAAQSAEDINGGYSESNKMVKFKVEFEVKNGTGGKDVVFRDKLDDLFTLVDDNNNLASVVKYQNGVKNKDYYYTYSNGKSLDGTSNWYRTKKDGECEFIIDKSNFYESDGTTPLASVKYEIEYYAKLADGNTDSYIAYAASTGQNYAEISLANADEYGNITDETDKQTSDMNSLAVNDRSIYRGYTISQTSNPQYDSNKDILTWSIEVNNQLTGDMSEFVVYDETLKHTNKVTISGEDYTSGAAGTKGTFNKENGTFTFGDNTTNNSYTLTYENLPDYNGYVNNGTGAKEGTVSQPTLKIGDRTIVQGNAIPIVKVSRKDDKNITVGSQYDWTATLTGGERAFIVKGDQDSNEVMLSFGTSNNSDVHYLRIDDNETNILNAVKITFKDSNGSTVELTRGTKGNASENKDYYISFYDDADAKNIISDENTILNKTAKVKGIRIGLNETNNSKTVSQMEIKYNTDRELNSLTNDSPIGSKAEFTTNVGWRGFVSKSFVETKQHQYIIFDYTNKAISAIGDSVTYVEKTDASYKTGDVTDGDNMILSWGIEGNYAAKYDDTGVVTYTVTLPTGASLVTSGDKAPKLYKHGGNSYDTGTAITPSVDGQNVTFTVSADDRKNGDTAAKFRIGFSVSIPKATAMRDANPATGKDFTVTVTDGKNQLIQTQNVVPVLITKSAEQQNVPKEVIDSDYGYTYTINSRSHYIDYTLDVNPDGIDLNPDDDTFVVEDYLKYDNSSNARPILVNIKVYRYSGNSETLLKDNEYNMNYRNSSLNDSLAHMIENLNYYYEGSKFQITLKDNYHYRIEYTYHYIFSFPSNYPINTLVDVSSKATNTASIIVNDTFVATTDPLDAFANSKVYVYDNGDDYATIEAVDARNSSKKVDGCTFALLMYDNTKQMWRIMTDADVSADGRIEPKEWADFEEITAGTKPSDLTYFPLGPTKNGGKTRLPELQQGIFYRVIEVKPNSNYYVNPNKIYAVYNTNTPGGSFPPVLYYDRLTCIYDYSGNSYTDGVKNQVGTVVIENEPLGLKDVTLNKEWADGGSYHYPVEFNTFRSYQSKTSSVTHNVMFTYKNSSGAVVKSDSFRVPYGSGFAISMKMTSDDSNGIWPMLYHYSTFSFTVNGQTVDKGNGDHGYSNQHSLVMDLNYPNTARNRIDENESTVYFSWPLDGSGTRTGYIPPGTESYTDASVWSKLVTQDLEIVLETYNDNPRGNISIVFPESADAEYDTFKAKDIEDLEASVPMQKYIINSDGTILELKDLTNDELNIELSESNNWTYTWHNLPEQDCYGFKYYYYVYELYDKTKYDSAEDQLGGLYHGTYTVRYYNNGAIKDDIITVVNHETNYIKSLPATGSSGKDFYMGIGLSIVGCAAITLFLRKRSRGVVQRP